MGLIAVANADARDRLDDYIEAHVHGSITLNEDVEALVLDPCFRGTDVEHRAGALRVPVEWHTGFRVHLDVLRAHAAYRGPDSVALGEKLSVNGWLDARMIGDAARSGAYAAQALKRVWHCVARFGAAEESVPPA